MTTQESLRESTQPDATSSCPESLTLELLQQQRALTNWLRGWHISLGLQYAGVSLGELMEYELSQVLNQSLRINTEDENGEDSSGS